MNEFNEIFKVDLPTPSDGDWAADARRRHGRRRASVVGGALALALVAVAVPVGLALSGGLSGVPVAERSAEPAPSPRLAGEVCEFARQSSGDSLPKQASRLWLCGDDGSVAGIGVTGPSDPLTIGVDEALGAFAQLEKAHPEQACTAEGGITYFVVAEQSDGALQSVTGGLYGCRMVGNKKGADDYLETLSRLWSEQRSSEALPEFSADAGSACSAPQSLLPAYPGGYLAAGFACPAGGPDTEISKATGVAADRALLDAVQASFAESAVSGGVTSDTWTQPRLVLFDPFGGSVVLHKAENGVYVTGTTVWRPDAELAAQLEALFERAPESPSQPPYDYSHPWCTDAASKAAQDLPDGRLPGGVTAVQVCFESAPEAGRVATPMDSIWDAGLVQRAVEAFDALPAGEACEEPGDHAMYVAYGNENSHMVVRAGNCGPSAGDDVRNGPDFAETILALQREQRNLSEGTTYGFDAAGLCPVSNSPLMTDLPTAPQSVLACLADGSALTVSPPLMERMAGEWGNQERREPAADSGATLIVVNNFGDPLTLTRDAEGRYWWNTSDGARVWTPSRDVAAELDALFNL